MGSPDNDLDLQAVLATGRPDVVAVAKSILQSAEIEFCVTGEEVQDLFGYGRFPGGYNVAMGPIRILVRAEDVSDASALLQELQPENASDAEADSHDELAQSTPHSTHLVAVRAAKIAVAVLLAYTAIQLMWALINSL